MICISSFQIRPQLKRMGFLFMEQEQRYYTLHEKYRNRFYRIPKVIIHNESYKKLRAETKLAYGLLMDRLELSIKNKWVDENGRIYFTYADEGLRDALDISKNHVTTIKKELMKYGLLEQKRMGLNRPNRLYLLKPEVTDNDIYKIEQVENTLEASSDKESHNEGIKNHTMRESRISQQGNQESHNEGTNDTDINDTDINDTDNNLNNMYTNNSSNSNQSSISDSNNIFDKDSHEKEMILNKYPNQIQLILKTLNSKDCKLAMDIILKAKSNIIKEHGKEYYIYGCDFSLEEHDQEIADTVRRVINEVKSKNSTLEKYQAYLMTSIKNYYQDYADYMLKEEIKRDMANTDVSNLFKM